MDLERLTKTLAAVATVRFNGHLLQIWVEDYEIVLFTDGRAIVRGTVDPIVAKRLYGQYIGS